MNAGHAYIDISAFVARWRTSALYQPDLAPWLLTTDADARIRAAMSTLDSSYQIKDGVAVHETAEIETGAIVKAPVILGPRTFVAANAYLRGGVFLDEGCIVGPACEVKTSFLFAGAKIAHLSFVGDSILGAGVNIEAGAIVANYRNELDDKAIRIVYAGATIETGVDRFGALFGDGTKIGANSVIAPGALLAPNTRIPRLTRVDQHPDAR
ncbi:glucosamine-1-phosphate N-acetyltransferase [alpha proteobacterium U9-1i]|nr:glucosamine-1-phosphate N-acetyltransferase [alpha proteobacterium U9-1i]